ncbi:MAG: ABC transporter ATP-binding protein [Deltaproteobacteria bacterium]|nr:ABC transporter ATP-binding protein [Deltaproteobacteria bacterium]
MRQAVAVHDLSISYGKRPILRDVAFSVAEGEYFVIIGPNGSGKTTLVKVISGSLKPQTGRVEIVGRSIEAIARRELARAVALVPQHAPVDVPFTTAEVVLMGRSPHLGLLSIESREDMEIVEQSMRFTNVEHLARSRLDQLSAGERQRVLIARAVCQRAGTIVLDEPTASLDIAHQMHIMDLMEKLRREQGVTVIMVSHDLNLAAMYANRILLLNHGKVARIGTADEVFQPGVIEPAYGCSLLIDRNPLREVPRLTPVPGEFTGSGPVK